METMSALWVYNFYIMLAVLLVATLLQSERLHTHQRFLWAPAHFYRARTHIRTWVNSFQLLVLEHAIAPTSNLMQPLLISKLLVRKKNFQDYHEYKEVHYTYWYARRKILYCNIVEDISTKIMYCKIIKDISAKYAGSIWEQILTQLGYVMERTWIFGFQFEENTKDFRTTPTRNKQKWVENYH